MSIWPHDFLLLDRDPNVSACSLEPEFSSLSLPRLRAFNSLGRVIRTLSVGSETTMVAMHISAVHHRSETR